ncbi:MAG: hypothetical protein K5656_07905 [Lachnospiraceae bacterium]|nr:hypothetical protein [Lachnospiraceae bacterium]
MKRFLTFAMLMSMVICFSLSGCASKDSADSSSSSEETTEVDSNAPDANKLVESDIKVTDTYENSNDGEHAITMSGEAKIYKNIGVTKTGEADGDEADFYGENSAVFATNGANAGIADSLIKTDGTHANAIFSYGEGTTVTVADSLIKTTGNCSGGLMTTGGGTTNATNLTIETTGNSSAAIRSDRGGGNVKVAYGYYETEGVGSPVIYSTANIEVDEAYLQSSASQGVVVEGKNSVKLNNCNMVASNTKKNSDKSEFYQAVMLYQSMSGDSDEGISQFSMTDGNLINNNGDVFFVNNTSAEISLENVTINNLDTNGVFLRAAAAGWGNEGANGGKLNLYCKKQTINGNILVDDISTLNMYLNSTSNFYGAINPEGQSGEVFVEINDRAIWILTEDSYVSGLRCDATGINLNGHKLYIDGVEYIEGNDSEGQAFSTEMKSVSSGKGGPDGGDGGTPPDMASADGKGKTPPDMASGDGKGGTPPDGGEGGKGGTPPDGGKGGTPPDKPAN